MFVLEKLKRTLPILSSAAVIIIYSYVFRLFDKYDWNHPFTKLLCFAILFALIVFLFKSEHNAPYSKTACWLEAALLASLLIYIILQTAPTYYHSISEPPKVDIGYTTQEAANIFFKNFENPYKKTGFSYGPMMFIGYGLSAYLPNSGFKITNAIYLICTLVVLYMLINEPRRPAENIASFLFVSVLVLMPERLWYELFFQGANDIFPIFLLLMAFLFIRKQYWLLSGLLAGISFSAKWFPAAVLIFLFIRKKIQWRFFIGAILGAIPLLIFTIWNHFNIASRYFVAHVIKGSDSTSLYSITPPELHYIFTLLKVAALLYFLIKSFNQEVSFKTLIIHFLLLLIIIEATYIQVHLNHLIWFIPILSIVLSWNRYNLFLRSWNLLKPGIEKL